MGIYSKNNLTNEEKAYERIYNKTTIKDENDCWPFGGSTTGNGYGHLGYMTIFNTFIKYPYAHVIAWSLANGRLPKTGLYILHSCDNPSCVNPKHLKEDTQKQNCIERDARKRRKPVSAETVKAIFLSKDPQQAAARRFNVSQAYVHNIRAGKMRTEVTSLLS